MTDTAITHTSAAWTEIEYGAACLSPYLATPVYLPKETSYFLCREDGTRKPARLSFVVFKSATAAADDEWEDDPMVGPLLIDVLGDGDEEVEPVEALYLGTEPEKFIRVAEEDDRSITFSIRWRQGSVSVEKAVSTDLGWKIRKEDFTEDGIKCTLSPRRGEPFSVRLQIPYMGFSLTDAQGGKLSGDLEIHPDEVDNYAYSFVGDDTDDRFSIVLDNGHLNYLCVLRDGGRLAVRNLRDKLAVVDEIGATGRLSELLMGAHEVVLKNKNRRWHITLGMGNGTGVEMPDCDAVALARHAYSLFVSPDGNDEQALANRLMLLEGKLGFQWMWLKEDDWSHEHLEGLMNLEGMEQNPKKMMEQALVYNRYESFMKRLCALSYVTQKPLQGDQLQARNNKRKIARCARTLKAHQAGELSVWDLTEEERREILHLFGTFHREFTAALEED